MSIVENYFDYRTSFINAIRFVANRYPDGCSFDRSTDRSTFLRSCRSVMLNMGRMSGKTESFIRLGDELSDQGGAVLITMNCANKRHVFGMAKRYKADVTVLSFRDIQNDLRNPANIQPFGFVMVDESEFILTDRHKFSDLYDWAAYAKANFVLKT